jgi:hypothetical protein
MKISVMAKENMSMPVEHNITETGKMTKKKAVASMIGLMAQPMMVNGRIICVPVRVCLNMPAVTSM